MSDGAPISQEIRLPTNSDELTAATKKLDELIARVHKMESAGEGHRKKTEETEGAFRKMAATFSKVIRGEIMMAEGFRGVSAAAGEAHAQTMEFLEFVGAIAALEVLEKIADKLIDIGKESLKSAANAERMNFAIDSSAGGKEAGENVRKWVEANAKFSEFSEEANETAYLNLRRFGVGQDKAGLYMKAAEDLAAVSAPGERAGVYQEALSSFARLHAKGRLDARSAMRLGIGVDDLKTLPGYKGLSNQKVFEKAEKGNLDENTLFALIMRHAGEKAIGEKAADASGLLLTKMTKLSELPELFYKRLADTGAVKKLTGEIDTILEKLDPESPAGKKIFAALESTFEMLADKIGEIDFDEVADTITEDVIPALKTMIGLIGPTLHAIETTVKGLGVAAHFLSGHQTDKEKAAAGVAFNKAATEAAGGSLWAKIKAPFLAGAAGVEKAHDSTANLPYGLPASAYKAGKAVGEGFAGGVQDSTGKAGDAAESLGESGISSLNASIDAHSPSRKAKRSGHFVGEGFALGIEGSENRIADAMDSTMRVPFDGFGGGGATTAAGLGRGVQVSFSDGAIQISVGAGANPGDTARAVREELIRSIRPALISALEETP